MLRDDQSPNADLIAFFEARSQRRRDAVKRVAKAAALTVVCVVLLILVVRTFLHVSGVGAHTTVNVTPNGITTTRTPVSILP